MKSLRSLFILFAILLLIGTAYSEREHIGRFLSPSNLIDGSIDRIQLNPDPGDIACTEGLYYWDDGDRTMALCTDIDGVVLQVGQEMFVKAVNKTGAMMDNGQAVIIQGAQGNRPKIILAQADEEDTSDGTIGVITEDIEDDATGYVTTTGLVRDIDTTAFSEGDTLWLSSDVAGVITNSIPAAPNHATRIGVCIVSHENQGIIFVNVINGYEIGELHDVAFSATSAAIANDTLIYNGTVWIESDESMAYGTLFVNTPDSANADSIDVTDGTIVTGSVTNTTIVDQVYLQVEETGSFVINSVSVPLTGFPAQVEVWGRYVGNPAHLVKAKAWNYDTEVWDDMTAETTDFPPSAVDELFTFNFPAISSDYRDGGAAKFAIDHESGPTGTHDFYLDRILFKAASVDLPSTTTPIIVNSLTEGLSNKMTLNGTLGTITLSEDGVYQPIIGGSFSADGTEDTTYRLHLYVNDAKADPLGVARGISGNLPGSFTSPTISRRYSANDVLSVKASTDMADTFMAFEHYGFTVNQIGK